MNVYLVAGAALAGIFLLLGVLFHLLGERACILISGFSTLPREERQNYDLARMSRDQRRSFFVWAAVLGAGAAGSLLSPAVFWCALALWLVLFFRQVRLTPERAFAPYRKESP